MERAAGGRRFQRLLGDTLAINYGPALRREFKLGALSDAEAARSDDLGLRWASLLEGRAIDGAALRSAPAPPDPASARIRAGVTGTDAAAFDTALANFFQWWDRRHAAPVGAWRADRLAAPFAIGAMTSAGPVTLHAPSHRGGRVDWHTFDVTKGALATGDPAPVGKSLTVLPGQLTFAGMPAPRWWQFENGTIDLGRLEAAPDDLGRLLLAEFALVYGNDFFIVPLTLPSGSVCRVTALEATTTFGETLRVQPAAQHDGARGLRWRMFHVSDGSPDNDSGAGLLVLPPCGVDVLDGPVDEQVLLARDETANAAWAIELRVTGPLGSPSNAARWKPPATDAATRHPPRTPRSAIACRPAYPSRGSLC